MTIKSIKDLMPPPTLAVDPPDMEAWMKAERLLDVCFPDDYKEFVSAYGSGRINGFLWVLNPASRNENIELLQQIEVRLDALRQLKSDGEQLPFDLFPSMNGILPVAVTDNGDVLFLRMQPNCNKWSVVINEARSPECEEFDLSWSDFIVALISNKIKSNIIPMSVFSVAPYFKSA